MKSKKNLTIELLEEHRNASVFSIRYDGEAFTEFEKFLLKFIDSHPEEVGIIMSRLEKIYFDGVFERHFRYAGRVKDRTAELPNNLDTTALRVYCICVSPSILILGNGGLKTTRTYQEDKTLLRYEEELQQIDYLLQSFEETGKIQKATKTLNGLLSFYIWVEE
jgi:hypothetical protein